MIDNFEGHRVERAVLTPSGLIFDLYRTIREAIHRVFTRISLAFTYYHSPPQPSARKYGKHCVVIVRRDLLALGCTFHMDLPLETRQLFGGFRSSGIVRTKQC